MRSCLALLILVLPLLATAGTASLVARQSTDAECCDTIVDVGYFIYSFTKQHTNLAVLQPISTLGNLILGLLATLLGIPPPQIPSGGLGVACATFNLDAVLNLTCTAKNMNTCLFSVVRTKYLRICIVT